MALLRKGGHVHLKEYGRGKPINDVTFGLAWDVTNGVNIDLDASVTMFNASLEVVDIVSYRSSPTCLCGCNSLLFEFTCKCTLRTSPPHPLHIDWF